MAKDEDSPAPQSKVQYKKFDNESASEPDACNNTSSSPSGGVGGEATTPTTATVNGCMLDDDDGVAPPTSDDTVVIIQRDPPPPPSRSRQDRLKAERGPPPVVEVPLHEAIVTVPGSPARLIASADTQPPNGDTPADASDGAAAGDTDGELSDWNWINLILSVCSIFCCTVCGILATVTAILAYIDHRVRDFEAASKKRFAAYALAITALVSGVVCMVIVVAVALHYETSKSP